jgi:hypothetical protein
MRLAITNCSPPETAAIAGDLLKQAKTTLDSHYLSRASDPSIGAIGKSEMHEARTRIPDGTSDHNFEVNQWSSILLKRLVAEEGLEPPTREL